MVIQLTTQNKTNIIHNVKLHEEGGILANKICWVFTKPFTHFPDSEDNLWIII